MNWIWKRFDELALRELYDAIQLRERVFVVGQKCIYLDCDGYDLKSFHLLGYRDKALVAYLRVLPQNVKYPEVAFGRVATAPEVRGQGIGKALTAEAIRRIELQFGKVPVRISAQAYLEKFYASFGFRAVGERYLEEDIPHVEMWRNETQEGRS